MGSKPLPGRGWCCSKGRRPAGYELYDTRNNTRRVVPLNMVNQIRTRVDDWRAAGYIGVTSITRQLLEHWHARGEWVPEETRWVGGPRQNPFYFCQLEAIETLIWWVEGSAEFKQGINVPGDGGAWERLCNKMATGSRQDGADGHDHHLADAERDQLPWTAASRAIFIVAPG